MLDISKIEEDYLENGFVLIRGFSKLDSISGLKNEVSMLVNKNMKKGYISNRMKVGLRLPEMITNGEPNIWGVEDPLSDLSELAFEQIGLERIRSIITQLTRMDFNEISLNRIHVQRHSRLHKLFWHHDADSFNSAIVANLYLQSEDGFRVTPINHSLNKNSDMSGSRGGSIFGRYSDFVEISAKPGDLLIFDGRLCHQPYSMSTRQHLHFVFRVNPELDSNLNVRVNSDTKSRDDFKEGYKFQYKSIPYYMVQVFCDYVERLIGFVSMYTVRKSH